MSDPNDQLPETYKSYTKGDVEYYISVFSDAAKEGSSPAIHCTRCAELVAILKDVPLESRDD